MEPEYFSKIFIADMGDRFVIVRKSFKKTGDKIENMPYEYLCKDKNGFCYWSPRIIERYFTDCLEKIETLWKRYQCQNDPKEIILFDNTDEMNK